MAFGATKEGEGGADGSGLPAGELEQQMGRMMLTFQDLSNFVDRCHSITVNLVHQLASLYHPAQKLYQSTFKHVHLTPAFDALADLLEVLITIDAMVTDNAAIAAAWAAYKRMLQFVRTEPSRYGVDAKRVKQFERLLVGLDGTVLAGACFQTCVEQNFEVPLDRGADGGGGDMVDVRNNAVFLEELRSYGIKAPLTRHFGLVGEATETDQRRKLVGVFGVYVLHRRLAPPSERPDEKLYKRLWGVQLRVPMVPLCHGKVAWFPSDFLRLHAPLPVKSLEPKDVPKCRRDAVAKMDDSFERDVAGLHARLASWLVWADAQLQPLAELRVSLADALAERVRLLLTGLILCYNTQTLLHTFMGLHVSLSVPIHKRNLGALCRCVEILKVVEATVRRKAAQIALTRTYLLRQLSEGLQGMFRPLRARLAASRRMDDLQLDMQAAITVIEDTLRGCDNVSTTRLMVVSLALRVVLMASMVKEADADVVLRQLRQLELLADFQRAVHAVCNCSFLYWNAELVPEFLKDIYAHPEQAARLHYIVAALSDAGVMLQKVEHTREAGELRDALSAHVRGALDEHVIAPLCRDVEKYLRLQIHSVHLAHMAAPNPKASRQEALGPLLDLRPLRIFDHVVSLRDRVAHTLDHSFYELTVLALHDWKTYAEMRNLAWESFGLAMSDTYLPMGTLDQGLDVLQIMRNIHIFVSRYNYNSNTQTFVERRSDKGGARHLNTISIHTIANSIRTHGTGMMNTTVNFTYQYLVSGEPCS
jgi:WASH complex subunit 7